MNPKISVIVPVYNANKYLTSIGCILEQTYKNFELILVDDGSTDGSGETCDNYAKKDSRVKVIHKKNAGASEARNTGIDSSSEELITFIDADDSISHDYLETLVNDYCKGANPDFVIQGMIQKWPDRNISFTMKDGIYDLSTDKGIRFFEVVKLNDFSGPCCKLYRRSILNAHHIRFSKNIIYAEDFDFMLRYLMHCKMIVASSATNYFYMMHEGSVSSKIYEFDKELSGLRQLYSSYNAIVDRFPGENICSNRNESINAYIWRVIYSNYRYEYSRPYRIANFEKIEPVFTQFFKINYVGSTLFTKVIKYLFSRRYFCGLDFILNYRLS